MKNVFLFPITLLTFILYGAEDSRASARRIEDIREATLIVGCVRGPGKVDETISRIVNQTAADFSHASSFPDEKVISVDMGPCRIKCPHVQGDWLTLPFARNSQRRVIFEWFPSSNTETFMPLLLPAVRKACTVLAPGGQLIIDHMPYSLSLVGDCKEALKTIMSHVSPAILREFVLSKLPANPSDRYLGIVSKLWQEYDPFTQSMSRRERTDILQYVTVKKLELEGKSAVTEFLDRQTNPEAVDLSVEMLSGIFEKERLWILTTLASEIQKSTSSELLNMFEWVYFMSARGPAMLDALRGMGFEVADDAIRYHKVNPYNGRHHAWIITATKPVV